MEAPTFRAHGDSAVGRVRAVGGAQVVSVRVLRPFAFLFRPALWRLK